MASPAARAIYRIQMVPENIGDECMDGRGNSPELSPNNLNWKLHKSPGTASEHTPFNKFLEAEGIDRVARGHSKVLLAVDAIAHRRSVHLLVRPKES